MVFKVRMFLEGRAISSPVLGKDHLLLMKTAWSKEVTVKCMEGLCALVGSVIPLCCLSKRCAVKEFHRRALILLWKHRERESILRPDLAG